MRFLYVQSKEDLVILCGIFFLKAQVDKGRKKIRIELYPRDT